MRVSSTVLLAAALAAAAPDARFGLVGTGGRPLAQKLGVPYYAIEGNHPDTGTLFHSANPANDPPEGHKVLRKVAKLNVRNDRLGQSNAEFEAALAAHATALALWHILRKVGPKPVFSWTAPDPAKLVAAESLHIIATIRREKARSPRITGTVWEIGNEPNLFPALTPERYAAIYARYHALIKREDPEARVALGPVFVRETGMDLLPRMRETVAAALDAAWPPAGRSLFNAVERDLWNTLSARILAMGTIEYFDRVFAALDTAIRPDVVSLHVYPFDDRPPAQTAPDIKRTLDSLADTLGARLAKRGISAPLWVTEFGNLVPGLDEDQAAAQASALIDVFSAHPKFGQWFYYKGTGFDAQLAGMPGLTVPLTRLVRDSAFEPADGNFPCSRLNAIGRMYYRRAVGEACGATAAFPSDSTRVGPSGASARTTTLRVRLRRAEGDTVAVTLARKHGLLDTADYALSPRTLVFAPGDTERTATLTWTGAREGAVTFALRDAVNGSVGPDSLHTVAVAANPVPVRAAARATARGISGSSLALFAAEALDLRLRVYDLSGNIKGTVRRRVEAGSSSLPLDRLFADAPLRPGLHFVELRVPSLDETTFHPWMRD